MGRPGDAEGGPERLPDLPPEWGPIIIPDDAAELAAEAVLVREELRREATQGRGQRRPAGGPPAVADGEPASLRLPLGILAIAVLMTLTSLFAVTWADPQRQLTGQPRPVDGDPGPLPALDLIDASGATVPLRGLLPAVIMIPERCACAEQIAAAADAAPPGVTVVTVTGAAARPSPPPRTGPSVRALADPASELRHYLGVTPRPGSATVLLVDAAGHIRRVVPASTSVEGYRADLAPLAPR